MPARYSLTGADQSRIKCAPPLREMADELQTERPPADELQPDSPRTEKLQTERKTRVLLTEEEKVKRRAETQQKYYLANKEALRPQRQAAGRRHYQLHKEELNRYATERRRQERELLKAAKASLVEGRPLIELVPDCYKRLAMG